MASMADSIEPYAVRTITSILGRNSFTFSRREIPPIPGMRTSVTSTFTGFLFILQGLFRRRGSTYLPYLPQHEDKAFHHIWFIIHYENIRFTHSLLYLAV